MATEIKSLAPASVWSYFYDLTQQSRPTGHTQQTQEYILEFARQHNLEAERDAVGNVLVRKPATAGLEGRPLVTLQSHLDMVPQKNADKQHDFTQDPIDAYIDGEWVKARGTTLGADNGIGVAYSLAVLAATDLRHGPIECLFTIDEETGMIGANGLQAGFAKGDILINMDSEDEGQLFIGCAGGLDLVARLEYQDNTPAPEGDISVKIALTGLKGGHSGQDINLGRANANKLMALFLKEAIASCGVRLVRLEGGSLRNAIPREAFAVVSVSPEDADVLWELASDYQDMFTEEYHGVEDSIRLELERCDRANHVVPEEIQDSIVNAIVGCANGVMSFQTAFPGVVESSSNMARVSLADGKFETIFLVRSSSEHRKYEAASAIDSIMNLAGVSVDYGNSYNGWSPNADSAILAVLQRAYEEELGVTPEVKVIHAGLECGILQGVMPKTDMISIGPDIRHPHSPDEKVHIASVERCWRVLCRALELV